jgi:hypothetical protein
MRKSPFWRVVAVVGVVGLLYVGHGLHNGGNDGLPSIVNTARAGGVSVSTSTGAHMIYTASDDGRILYLWASGDSKPKFVAKASVGESPIDRREGTPFRPRPGFNFIDVPATPDGPPANLRPAPPLPTDRGVPAPLPFPKKKPIPDFVPPPADPKEKGS